MDTKKPIAAGLAIALLAPWAGAQDEPGRTLDLNLEDIRPDVATKDYDNRSVDEYRVNNNLYMMKITPKSGEPYYLVDPDGTGQMEWRRNSMDSETNIRVPQWTLFRF